MIAYAKLPCLVLENWTLFPFPEDHESSLTGLPYFRKRTEESREVFLLDEPTGPEDNRDARVQKPGVLDWLLCELQHLWTNYRIIDNLNAFLETQCLGNVLGNPLRYRNHLICERIDPAREAIENPVRETGIRIRSC